MEDKHDKIDDTSTLDLLFDEDIWFQNIVYNFITSIILEFGICFSSLWY